MTSCGVGVSMQFERKVAGWLLAGSAVLLGTLVSEPARADCVQNGSTVNCAPPGTAGFAAATGVNNLAVTVQPGTTVVDNGIDAIQINAGSTVTNNGNIATGNGTAGIASINDDNNTVINNGTMSVGTNGTTIFVNNGGGVTNNGTLTLGGSSSGLDVLSGLSIVNAGKILGVDSTTGISAGNTNTIRNSGTIATGDSINFQSFGLRANDGNTVTNSGAISTGQFGIGIRVRDGNTLGNTGSIAAGNGGSGIAFRNSNIFTNSGSVSAGDGAAVVAMANGNTFINSGTVMAGVNSYSLLPSLTAGADKNALLNTGTIDGLINLFSDAGASSSNAFTNAGLITISNPKTVLATHFIEGSFTQTAAGTLALRVSPNPATGYDALSVKGDAATDTVKLGGTLRALVQPGLYQNSQTYTGVVSFAPGAGAMTGTFSQVASTTPFLTASATYNPLSVDLTLTRVPFNAVPGETPNQVRVASAIEASFTQSGSAPTFFQNLLQSTSTLALDFLSGQGTTALQSASFGLASQFNDMMRFQAMNGDFGGGTSIVIPSQYAATRSPRGADAFASLKPSDPALAQAGRWRVWTAGFGAHRSVDGDTAAGTTGQSIRNYGGAFGIDHLVRRDLLIGFSAGGGEATTSVSSLATSGQVTAAQLGAYAVKTWGAWYAAGILNYARLFNSTTRTIAGVGPTEIASGHFGSDQLSGRLEAGWKHAFAGYNVTPFAAIEPSALWAHAYTESSNTLAGAPGVLGLSFANRTITSFPAFLGVQVDTRTVLASGAVLTPYARVAWVHEFEPNRQIAATFVSVPTAAFTVDGARASTDAARIDAGANFRLDTARSFFANLTGEWGNASRSYAATAGFRMVR